MDEWYYRLNGANQGPVSEADLKHVFECGALPLNTPVWREGMEEWLEFKHVQVVPVEPLVAASIPPNTPETALLDGKSSSEKTVSPTAAPTGETNIRTLNAVQPHKRSGGPLLSSKWVIVGVICICLAGVSLWSIKKTSINGKNKSEEKDGVVNAQTQVSPNDQGHSGAKNWEEWKRLAELGDSDHQVAVGMTYHFGCSYANKDSSEAVKWFRRAAEQGNAKGQYWLGRSYFDGEGVDKDETEAVKWYRASSAQGNQFAEYSLGGCYLLGMGVDKDIGEGVKWLRKSAGQGNADAKDTLREMGY